MTRQYEYGWKGGDVPGELHFEHSLSDASWTGLLIETVQAVFPPSAGAADLSALQNVAGPAGSYCLSGGDKSWFVRVSSRRGDPELERHLLDFLLEREVSVNPLLMAGAAMEWEGLTYRVDVRPLVVGRHYARTPTDLIAVSEATRRCHDALIDYPRAAQVQRNKAVEAELHTKARGWVDEALVRDEFGVFGERQPWAVSNKDFLRELVEGYEPNQMDLDRAQCVHGEIHPGNVIYDGDGAAVLVDFEDAPKAFGPVEWDMAYLVQRFCLNHFSGSELRGGLETVARAYGNRLDDLAGAMRQTCWYCVIVAVVLATEDTLVPVSEYRKFAKMAKQADRMRSLLQDVFC